jgi:hypothetical protein
MILKSFSSQTRVVLWFLGVVVIGVAESQRFCKEFVSFETGPVEPRRMAQPSNQ